MVAAIGSDSGVSFYVVKKKKKRILCSNQSCAFFSDLEPYKGRDNFKKGY